MFIYLLCMVTIYYIFYVMVGREESEEPIIVYVFCGFGFVMIMLKRILMGNNKKVINLLSFG